MTFRIPLAPSPKTIVRGTIPQGGASPSGETFTVNNYYFERDGTPFFAVSGEFHFSRCDPRFWEDGLAKMKAGGIDLVSTYVFWNHHEEVEGEYEWAGPKDLRRFVELCGWHGLKAIVRLGPFCHGEVRNGGLPDWLRGQAFEVRSNDEGYLAHVRRFYAQIAGQLKGLSFGEGGPVWALQLENEYGHAGAPWEATTATTREWLPSGQDGGAHLLVLKRLAQDCGLQAPFWTATAWGGAAVPVPEALPLWGGYAYQPWLIAAGAKEHPATGEALFRDHHNNAVAPTPDFAPAYRPEDYPYSCCEMGGGMQVWYPYRFTVPPASVEAMAVVKTAGGCNVLGYYMYHGGTNPRGRVTPFLNEHTSPQLSYDFQAPLGEFGRPREHFHRLRLLHSLLHTWQSWVAPLATVLPPGSQHLDPKDNAAVRWSLRTDGRQGLLFVTNFQDHWQRDALRGLSWELDTPTGPVRFPAEGEVGLAADESCVLPFRLPLGALVLESATAQPVTCVEAQGRRLWVFAAPAGMEAVFHFSAVLDHPEGLTARPTLGQPFEVQAADGTVETLLVLAKADALTAQVVEAGGSRFLVLTSALVFPQAAGQHPGFRVEAEGDGDVTLLSFPALPPCSVEGALWTAEGQEGLFERYGLRWPARPAAGRELSWRSLGDLKALVSLAPEALDGVRELLLKVVYEGDVARAFVRGGLAADNFANGEPWNIGVARLDPRVFESALVIEVAPLRGDGAPRGSLTSIQAVAVRQAAVSFDPA